MTRSRPTLTAIVVVATLILAACGGGDTDTTSGGSPADSAGTTPSVEVGGGFDGSAEDCTQLASAYLALVALPVMGFMGEDALAETDQALADLDARVPSELAEDYKVIEDAYAEFTAALGGASITDAITDPAVADQLEQASQALETPEVEAALASFTTFLEENCSDFGFSDFTP